MADAIHKTSSAGQSLEDVAKLYYELLKPSAEVDRVGQHIVIRAIRQATPTAVTNLTGVTDNTPLQNTTLFVPTIRSLNRALLVVSTLPSTLADDLRAKGLLHARKLLRRDLTSVQALMAPTYSANDIQTVYVMTQLFNLDGMDRFTAAHLYANEGITSLATLAAQTPATLLGILQALVTAGRPAQLDDQKHEFRWPREARIYTRTHGSEPAKAHWTRQFVPQLPAKHLRAAAEHQERASRRTDRDRDAARCASALAVIHRLQERVSAGHHALIGGRHREAVGHYEAARTVVHRWLFEAGVVSSPVDAAVGVSLNTVILGTKRLLEALPDGVEELDEESGTVLPGGASGNRRASEFGLRGFRFTELTTAAKGEINLELTNVKLRSFPRAFRHRLARQVLDKLHSELNTADTNLVLGLSSSSAGVAVRDFDPQDRQRVVRNLGASNYSVLATAALGLMDDAALQGQFLVSDVAALVTPTFWASPVKASDKISTASSYPTNLTARSPFIRFVLLPPLVGSSVHQALPIEASDSTFQTDWVEQFAKDRLKSNNAPDLYPSRAVWESPSAFAVWIPILYGKVLPRGLSLAHARRGLTHTATSRPVSPQRQLNVYDTGGNLVGPDRHTLPPNSLVLDQDLVLMATPSPLPATTDTFEELQQWTAAQIAEADHLYGIEDLAGARSLYGDVVTAVRLFDADAEYAEEAATTAVATTTYGNDIDEQSPPRLWEYEEDLNPLISGAYYEPRDSDSGSSLPKGDGADTASTMFQLNAVPNPADLTRTSKVSVEIDTLLDQHFYSAFGYYTTFGWTLDDDAGYKGYIWGQYLYASAMIKQIDLGLNQLGYRTDYVPPWAFEHLYQVARDLCGRALETEQRVLSFLQLQESTTAEEMVAGSAVVISRHGVRIAKARMDERIEQNNIAVSQAVLAALQQQIAARQNRSQGWAAVLALSGSFVGGATGVAGAVAAGAAGGAAAGTVVPGPGNVVGAVVGALVGITVAAVSAVQTTSKQGLYNQIAAQSATLALEAMQLAAASFAVAEEELSAAEAKLAADQAYLHYLTEERELDSEAYAKLLSDARELSDINLAEATRMAWLAQRAASHETRRVFTGSIATSYDTEDVLDDLMRAQRLVTDLERVRASYVAGETQRRQEIKFTLSLRDLQPGALAELRASGECVFIVEQQMIDRAFPGLSLHALQDMRITFVGTLPPEGPRGTLTTLGHSWVRVPNSPAYFDGAVTADDWPEAILQTGATGYVLKQVNTLGTTLALSEFDVQGDRVVLRLPQGMLRPVELLGLDNAWMLRLHPRSTRFPFTDIFDLELTFWFLAVYDSALEEVQQTALDTMALTDGTLQGTMIVSASQSASVLWGLFTRNATTEEIADVRYLVFDRGTYAPSETYANKRLTNLYIGTSIDQEIVLRLMCSDDPVGLLVTTKLGCVFTALGTTWPGPPDWPDGPRKPDTALETWVSSTFYSTGSPSLPPSDRWVLKLVPEKANPAGGGFEWRALDDDGEMVTTTYGPLTSGAGGRCTWEGKTTLAHVRLTATLRTNGGTVRLLARQVDANNVYRLVIEPNAIKLTKLVAGSESVLQTRSLSYPGDEPLFVLFDVYGDATGTSLRVEIDTIEVLNASDSTSPHLSGRVGLEVAAAPSGTPWFDDASVAALSKLGIPQFVLVEERFSSTTLPADWDFSVAGTPAWAVSTAAGHVYADPSALSDVVLRIDYGFTT